MKAVAAGGAEGARRRGRDLWGALSGAPLVSWLAARAVVTGAVGLAAFVSRDLGRTGTGAGGRDVPRGVSALLSWDADWYLAIARHGYAELPEAARRFFPLQPAFTKFVGFITTPRVAALLVANVAALGAAFLLRRLLLHERGDRALADRAVWFVALFPSAFVLVMGYAEGLFLLATVAAFVGLREQRWWLAAAAGAAAALTRPVGVVLVVPALIEVVRARSGPAGDRATGTTGTARATGVARAAAVVGPAAGLAAYLAWVGVRFGDAFGPLRTQTAQGLRGPFENPLARLVEAGRDLVEGDLVGSGLHLPWALLGMALLVVVARRWPASYTAHAGLLLLAALSASNLDSLERYLLGAFPLLIAAADIVRVPAHERAVTSLFAAGLAGYATLAFLGAYVP